MTVRSLPAEQMPPVQPPSARARSGSTSCSPVTVEGRLTRTDGKALGLKPLAVTRRLVHGTKEPIAGVTTQKDGTFTFEDTPPDLGEVTYWAAKALHQIMVE
ncbi:hypothetical protein ACIBF7_20545 [Nonomuraea sp. NPDC050478]|uniref:hypothetical protein n=2 Tax=unclassified Nonomuraea TaxID=2593643 RepID=UPI003793B704